MRRLPIYIVIDTSESMVGEPIKAVEKGLVSMLSTLRKDPYALETAYLSVITFGTMAKQVVSLTELSQFRVPKLVLGSGTALGAALELLEKRIAAEVAKSTSEVKGDYKPLVFLMTDGEPTDRWEAAADRLMRNRALQLVAIGCGPDTNLNTLRRISELVVTSQEANEETLTKFFRWVSSSVATASQSVDATGGDTKISLEKFPQDDNIKVVDETTPQPAIIPNRFVFLHAKCIKNKKFYLKKYVQSKKAGGFFGLGGKNVFVASGAFPLDDFEKIGQEKGCSISVDQIQGDTPCPYCGNASWALCLCEKVLCCPELKSGQITLTCPWCNATDTYGAGTFDVGGGAG